MVQVRQATSWKAVTSLLLLSVSEAARLMFVAVRVVTDAQLLAVALAQCEMELTVSCQYTWLDDWWSTRFVAWYLAPLVVACNLRSS